MQNNNSKYLILISSILVAAYRHFSIPLAVKKLHLTKADVNEQNKQVLQRFRFIGQKPTKTDKWRLNERPWRTASVFFCSFFFIRNKLHASGGDSAVEMERTEQECTPQ